MNRGPRTSLRQLDLHLLVALDALLRERQVTRAAQRAGISAPSMSRALHRLRGIFDDQLLARAGRGYQLTPVAERLQGPVREILLRVDQLGTLHDFDPSRDTRRFRIAAPDGMALLFMGRLNELFLRECPGLSLAVDPLIGRQTIELIESGVLDLALWSLGDRERHLCRQQLYLDRMVAAVWAQRTDIGERMTQEQFDELPRAHYYTRSMQRVGERFPAWLASEDPPVRFSSRAHLLRLHLLRGTDLVAISYDTLIRHVGETLDVRAVELPFEPEPLERGMVWHPRNTNDPAHRWLRERLVEIAQTL